MFLVIIGYALVLISSAWLTWIAFKESILCGLLMVVVPFYAFYYIATRWSRTREPFLLHLVGWLILFVGL